MNFVYKTLNFFTDFFKTSNVFVEKPVPGDQKLLQAFCSLVLMKENKVSIFNVFFSIYWKLQPLPTIFLYLLFQVLHVHPHKTALLTSSISFCVNSLCTSQPYTQYLLYMQTKNGYTYEYTYKRRNWHRYCKLNHKLPIFLLYTKCIVANYIAYPMM